MRPFIKVKPVILDEPDILTVPPVITVESIPAPFKIMFSSAGIITVELQVQLPDGTLTVSPLAAESIAFCTADCEQFAAICVAGVIFVPPF